MTNTRASVATHASQAGLEPYQIDGIPEGFSFIRKNERQLGHIYDYGDLVAYTPGKESVAHMPIVLSRPSPTRDEITFEKEAATWRLVDLYKSNSK